ncbi:MSMEG_4193 family putative phosphomutase [Gordonia sp. DT30]|uniref:MSMEG_4193 family putative phosphomutase n=1 Tax=Gordonia sp. DT30 TaxID=3416546 RepID=UPI003CF2DB85
MTVILVRHGRSTANTSGVLAGRSPGVALDEKGQGQAAELVERLTPYLPAIGAVARSPLQRCAETMSPLLGALIGAGREVPEIVVDDLAEVDYGAWTNRTIGELLKEPLWKTVQQHPSAAVFPDGEGLAAVQARAVAAIRALDRIHGGPDGAGVWVACSHGDVIKAILADAMGMHLDAFQRIVVEPASVSVIRYSDTRPYVHTVNSTKALSVPLRRPASDDAVVGGDQGTDEPGGDKPESDRVPVGEPAGPPVAAGTGRDG